MGTPLKDWDINIYRGVLTGFNEAFIITGDKKDEILANCKDEEERIKTDELIRPILRGRDIKRYSYEFADLYLIATFPSKQYNIDEYPAVKSFLVGFKPKLQQAGEKLTDAEIISVTQHAQEHGISISKSSLKSSRKKTNNKWFETQDSISYWEDFNKQKICWKAVGRNLSFSLVEPGIFLTAPASFITSNYNPYILAFLCSKVAKYFIFQNSDTTGAGDIMLNIQSLVKFPIPKLKISQQKTITNLICLLLKKQKKGNSIVEIEKKIDVEIYKLYNLSKVEILTIESI